MRRLTAARAGFARGITLVEVMVAIAVMALLATAAAPYLGDFVTNARMREAGNGLYAEALMAQSEAVKRNTTVRVTLGATTVQVFDLTTPGNPVLLRSRTVPQGAVLPAATFDFGPEGRPVPFGTSVSVNLSIAGGAGCSDDLRCPGLRIDAGGATRLCANHLQNCG